MSLRKCGFSLWCDFIERDFLDFEFRELINNGVIYGATSNPSIFANAILKSDAYTKDKDNLKGKKAKEIYENLAFSDIKKAAEIMLPLWKIDNDDGFISIEIDPLLCDDVPKSIDEGRRIYKEINMPNVMIKVPATNAGFEIMNELYKSGININATLLFSAQQVRNALDSICNNKSRDANKVVLSVFVSRFDRLLESINKTQDSNPKLGIYNAMNCYNLIQDFGNPNIRVLFASTGVKDDFIAKDYYISNLLLKNSINTAPLDTIRTFMNNSADMITPSSDIDTYLSNFDLEDMSKELLDDGLNAFKISFEDMLKNISK